MVGNGRLRLIEALPTIVRLILNGTNDQMAGKIIYRDTILLMAFLTCFVFLAARDFAPAYADSMQRQGAGDDGSWSWGVESHF